MKNKDVFSSKLITQYPLLEAGFEPVNCPMCEKLCYPTNKTLIGTIRFNLHMCNPHGEYALLKKQLRSFGVSESGKYILPVPNKKNNSESEDQAVTS